jgi:IclR family acetate operon transcriptional repressor
MNVEAVSVKPPADGRVQSVERAIELLQAVAAAREPEPAAALADRCGLNRSTAWRLLATLEHHGLVERDPATHRYSIAYGIVRLAAAAGHEPLARAARPLLRRLAAETGETANLAAPNGLELVYADQVQASHVMAADWLGRTTPLHATSTGKAFLAALAPGELEAALTRPLERYTAATLTDPAALRAELGDVRRLGYATSRGELEPSLWGASAAVPDGRGGAAAVLSVWGTEFRVREHGLDRIGAATLAAARELGALLAA